MHTHLPFSQKEGGVCIGSAGSQLQQFKNVMWQYPLYTPCSKLLGRGQEQLRMLPKGNQSAMRTPPCFAGKGGRYALAPPWPNFNNWKMWSDIYPLYTPCNEFLGRGEEQLWKLPKNIQCYAYPPRFARKQRGYASGPLLWNYNNSKM